MKKILSILIFVIIIWSSLSAIAATEKDNSEFLTIYEAISISEPVIKQESEFVTISLKECNSYLSIPGSPMLPLINKIFTLPFGSIVDSVEVRYIDEKEILISKPVQTVTEPRMISHSNMIISTNNINSNSGVIPQEKFKYRLGSGFLEGNRVLFLTVECYPIIYNSENMILYYYKEIEINICYSKGKSFDFGNDEYDLLIISAIPVTPSIQKLIDHKNEYNIRTSFKLVNEIYDEYDGRDKPEKIKYFIKDAIETYGISYVLLLGNIRILPIRHTTVYIWHQTIDIPTDIYYADIYDAYGNFCSWDSNGNDIFGEFNFNDGNIDDLDLYADVMVGRIPYHNILDLNVVINKIIKYETSAYSSDWFKKILLMGGDTFPNHGNIEGEFVTNLVGEEMEYHGFELIKLWTSKNTFNPLNINLKTTAGAGFISYSGHGYEHGFGTSPPNVEQRISYYNINLLGMFNGNKLPIVFFDACSTAILDRKLFDILDFPGFAYNVVKKINGGGIAAIGATRVAFTHVDSSGVHGGAGFLNLHFFKNYEEGTSLGEMFTKSQYDYLTYVGEDCVTLVQFIIIGDPSLKIGGYP